ncbi:MAG TPA: cytochrome P460 family protein [Terracidiphilus sp.]
METRAAMRRIVSFNVVVTAIAVFAILATAVVYAQEKYALISPGGGRIFPDGSMIVKLQWKPKKSAEAQFAMDVPDVFTQAFVMEKDSKRFPKTGGWGYAVFNYETASNKFVADPKSFSDCGNACHTAVKTKDNIFHPYEKR